MERDGLLPLRRIGGRRVPDLRRVRYLDPALLGKFLDVVDTGTELSGSDLQTAQDLDLAMYQFSQFRGGGRRSAARSQTVLHRIKAAACNSVRTCSP